MRALRAVVTGGGTGGHIYPALAVVDALRDAPGGADVRYVGGVSGMEARIVPAAGVPFVGITTRKLRKLASPGTVGVLLALLRGYREARALVDAFRPDVVLGTGGYVAAATVLASARAGVPTAIHEQNAVIGRTNRLLARWARCVCVSFEESLAAFPTARTVLTGVPVRAGIVSEAPREEARACLGLRPGAFALLVLGGSQGARALNALVPEAAERLEEGVQVVHQTGEREAATVEERASALRAVGRAYVVRPYLDAPEFALAYRAADLVVCRCGASTLAEVTANGLPSLLVPYPAAYADHQTANARAIERAGAGVLLPEGTLTAEALAERIEGLRRDAATRASMADRSRALARPHAARDVCRAATALVAGRGSAAAGAAVGQT